MSAVLTVSTLDLDTQEPTGLGTPTLDSKTDDTVSFSWTAGPDNVGVTEYRIFRDAIAIATVSAPTTSFTDTNLTPATTYSYHVTALDAAGNESLPSGILEVTTDPGPGSLIHIGGIAIELRRTGRWNSARAVVNIVDGLGNPVDGATVTVEWSGLATNLDSGSTSGGDVDFDSDKVDNSLSGQFVITVTDVTASGLIYDPTTNLQTEACIDTSGNPCTVGESDTEPPVVPEPLTATAGPGWVSLDWPDNTTDADWASFSIYRSTTAGSGHALIAAELTSSEFTDNDVTAGTTYYYMVTATDLSGNESGPSNEASATPTEPIPLSIHVDDISITIVNRGRNYSGTATVTVLDQDGNPTAGVEVIGTWTWNSTDIGISSELTDGNGIAILDSSNVKAVSGDVLTFSVTELVLSSYTYDPASDVETSDSATVP